MPTSNQRKYSINVKSHFKELEQQQIKPKQQEIINIIAEINEIKTKQEKIKRKINKPQIDKLRQISEDK